ncbi:MAG: AraC family transcriptional regulator [Oscillospiraceae bacterium]
MDNLTYSIKKFVFTKDESKPIYSENAHNILLVTHGKCFIKCDSGTFPCAQEDIALIKPNTRVLLQHYGGKYPSEMFLLSLSNELLEYISDEGVNLAPCFEVVPNKVIIVRGSTEIIMLIKSLCIKLGRLSSERGAFAANLFEKSLLQMLTVLILRACIQVEMQKNTRSRKTLIIDDIFAYIHEHLSEEISLDRLEKEFYVSKYHISREFKRQTGDSVHSYIVKAKLNMCKKLISAGKPITEVYQLAGFGGYNNFFRAFKREFNMTPKEYFNSNKKE